MPGIAHSMAKKKQMACAEQEKAYAEAMKEYHDEEKKPKSERKSRKAICRNAACCREVESNGKTSSCQC